MIRSICLILVLVVNMSVSGQGYHKCTIYAYGGKDSTHKKLAGIQIFNDHGKIISHDNYGFTGHNSPIRYQSVCGIKTRYFYKDDTVLVRTVNTWKNSVFNSYEKTVYVYNERNQLTSDTEFHWSNMLMPNHLDTTVMISLYEYDERGNKVKVSISLDTFKTKFTESIYAYDSANRVSKAEHYAKGWHEKDGQNVKGFYKRYWEKYHYKYKSKMVVLKYSQEDSLMHEKETHYTYSFVNNKLVREKEMEYRLDSARRKTLEYIYITHYGYFPDKRIIRVYSKEQEYNSPADTKIYLYE